MKSEYPMAQKKLDDMIREADYKKYAMNNAGRDHGILSDEAYKSRAEYKQIKEKIKIEYGIEYY